MKKFLIAGLALALGACSTTDQQVAEALKKNPKLVFDAIEQNPEQFIEVVNKAARKAQEGAQEKQMADMKRRQDDQLKNPLKPALSEDRLLFGNAKGDITIVEYADFECPYCEVAYKNLKPIKEKYKDRIKFYYKHVPLSFHKMAMPAAIRYEAVYKQDKEKARKYYTYLFENQRQMQDEKFLNDAAKKLGVDMKKMEADMKSAATEKQISDDTAEFEKFGFSGTPAIVINGVALEGAQPTAELEKVIQLTTTK
ncbi:MAG: thioredoxin domain-containing protein [Bdellovibrionales bacterium]|nr:thioredoxin domain-containing protein [Bdellovibrionales bacterium]